MVPQEAIANSQGVLIGYFKFPKEIQLHEQLLDAAQTTR